MIRLNQLSTLSTKYSRVQFSSAIIWIIGPLYTASIYMTIAVAWLWAKLATLFWTLWYLIPVQQRRRLRFVLIFYIGVCLRLKRTFSLLIRRPHLVKFVWFHLFKASKWCVLSYESALIESYQGPASNEVASEVSYYLIVHWTYKTYMFSIIRHFIWCKTKLSIHCCIILIAHSELHLVDTLQWMVIQHGDNCCYCVPACTNEYSGFFR